MIERECENCFTLGLIGTPGALVATPNSPSPPTMLTLKSGGAVVGVAVQTRPIAIAVTRLPNGAPEVLVDHLARSNWPGRGFTAPLETADRLADLWAARSGQAMRERAALRVFQLTEVVPPRPAAGRMVRAAPAHLDVLAEWHDAFNRFIGQPADDPRGRARAMIDEQRAYLWEEGGEPCSMAAVAGPTPNGGFASSSPTWPTPRPTRSTSRSATAP